MNDWFTQVLAQAQGSQLKSGFSLGPDQANETQTEKEEEEKKKKRFLSPGTKS